MSLASPILTSDTEGTKFAKLQRLIRLALDNAGISYTMSGLLTPILTSDTQGTKWAKLGAWMQQLASNISGGGGSGVSSIIAGAGISVNQATGAVTVTNTGSAPTGYATVTNNTGNTTVTPTIPLYDLGVNVTGSARTSILILATAGRTQGDRARLLMTFPATAAIVLEVRNATAGGTLLFPADIFTSQQYTTNGFDLSAVWEFEYTGSAWRFVMSNIPA